MLVAADVNCPTCGEALSLAIDTLAGRDQRYYEDCAVCCRPMSVRAECEPGALVFIAVSDAS